MSSAADAERVPQPSGMLEGSTKICGVCGHEMPTVGVKCTACDSYQNWRRFIPFSSTVLGLLLALVSVVALSIPQVDRMLQPNNSDIRMTLVSADSEAVSVFARNRGDRDGVVSGGSIHLFEPFRSAPFTEDRDLVNGPLDVRDQWNETDKFSIGYPTQVLFTLQPIDDNSAERTDYLVRAGESRVIRFAVGSYVVITPQADFDAMYSGTRHDCVLDIGVVPFDGDKYSMATRLRCSSVWQSLQEHFPLDIDEGGGLSWHGWPEKIPNRRSSPED